MPVRFKVDVYSKVVLTLIAACLVWLCVRDLVREPAAEAQLAATQPGGKRVIEATEFRVVDEEGKARAILTLHPGEKEKPYYENKTGLYLYDRQGVMVGEFAINDRRAGLAIRGPGKSTLACVGVHKQQTDGSQAGFVEVRDTMSPIGRSAVLGSWLTYDKGPGPASAIHLADDKRNVIWKAP